MTPNPYLTELAQSMAPSLEPVTRPFHADCLEPESELHGGKTGAPPGMLQDDHRPLHRWLANRVDSRMHAREAAQAIADECLLPDLDAMRAAGAI